MPESFIKIRFTNGYRSTAGIVLPAYKVENSTLSELSRYFPMFEYSTMQRLELSPPFATFDLAFFFEF